MMRRLTAVLPVVLALALLVSQPLPARQAASPRASLHPLDHVTVTILVDNFASGDVLAEWGLSFFVDTGEHRVLFDTGGGRVLIDNARALGVDLSRTEAIVVSHGHADHTGGIEKALDAAGRIDVFVHPAAFGTAYWKEGDRVVPETMPVSREQLSARVRRLVETKGPTPVVPGMMATGEIPRLTTFEDSGITREAFLDERMKTPDPVRDDQALFFRVPEGIVVLVGCAHAGVVNTLRYVTDLTGERRIYAVLGGTHLITASPERIRQTVVALKRYDVQKIMLLHCTGIHAFADLSKALPGRCDWPGAGARIEFGGTVKR